MVEAEREAADELISKRRVERREAVERAARERERRASGEARDTSDLSQPEDNEGDTEPEDEQEAAAMAAKQVAKGTTRKGWQKPHPRREDGGVVDVEDDEEAIPHAGPPLYRASDPSPLPDQPRSRSVSRGHSHLRAEGGADRRPLTVGGAQEAQPDRAD